MPPKTSKTSKTTKAKKTSGKKSTVEEPVAVVVAPVETVPEPVVETAPESTPESASTGEMTLLQQIEADFTSLNDRLAQFRTMYSSLTTDLRKLQKTMTRHVRENSRKKRRKTPADGKKRSPSGFAKPALISNELCNFLGKPSGTEMARTEVTKHLTSYIKEHNLQDQANKRRILPDKALKDLLNLTAEDEVTYFNLQKYMKVHFPKSAATLALEAANASA
jgi:chromatin remodeling complex protein RSC6